MIFFLGLLFLIFFIQNRFLEKNGKFSNRRSLTGAEVARFVLDASGLKQTSVDCFEKDHIDFRSGLERLYLDRKLYEGKTLLDVAASAWTAVLKTKAHQSTLWLPLDFKEKIWKINKVIIWAGWILIPFFPPAGLAAFLFVFLIEILDFPARLEIGQQALLLLKHSRNFEADEIARLKGVIRGLELKGFARFFGVVSDLFKGKARVYGL